MRVISGSAKRHNLKTIEGLNTRPTTDRIKETLFNIIPMDLSDICFLDLFSGSGAIGIEALSRGAKKAIFVDSNSMCTEVIKDNLEHTKLKDKGLVLTSEVNTAIEELNRKEKFDIIFMDPPYDKGFINLTLKKILRCDILKDISYIIIESSQNETFEEVKKLKIIKEKDFKITKIIILEHVIE